MQGQLYTFTGGGLQPFQNPELARTQPVVLAGGLNLPAGQMLGLVAGTGTAVNEVQTIDIDDGADGGTFKLLFGGQMTAAIARNASAATIQAALEALTSIGTGNVVCAGGALPGTAVTVTFQGQLAGRNVPMLVVADNSVNDGGVALVVSVVETTPGKPAAGHWAAYNDALSDGTEVARAILKDAVETNPDGSIKSLNGSSIGGGPRHAVAYVNGVFLGSQLTGLDANGLADMRGVVVQGIPGTLTSASTVIRFP